MAQIPCNLVINAEFSLRIDYIFKSLDINGGHFNRYILSLYSDDFSG